MWRAKVKHEGPRAWYKKGNVITRKIANLISQDALIPLNSPGGENIFRIAGDLLDKFQGDDALLIDAIEISRREKPNFRGMDPYVMRKVLENQASKEQFLKRKAEEEADDFWD